MNAHRIVVTSELRQGDIVNCHGLRCLVDGEILISRSHADSPGVGDGKTRYTRALVLNRTEVPHQVVPHGWTHEDDGTDRWTIQGNDLARWFVEEAQA